MLYSGLTQMEMMKTDAQFLFVWVEFKKIMYICGVLKNTNYKNQKS